MKKRVLTLLLGILFLLSLARVHAELQLSGPSQTKVSLGDNLQVNGYLLQQADTLGLLKFELACAERKTILVKSVNLKANVQKTFDESLAINDYLPPPCHIEASLEVNSQVIETVKSSSFEITKELEGDINIDKTSVQLGEDINIDGVITRPDGTAVTGSATITFKKGGTIYLQEVVPVKKGKFSYNYNTQDNPSGDYDVEIEVADSYQNKQIFIVPSFTILGEITLTAEIEKTDFLPGEDLKLSGTAVAGTTNVKEGTIIIEFNNLNYEVGISRGKFKTTISIPEDIRSGLHTLSLSAEDTFGNRVATTTPVQIIPIPTTLRVITNTNQLQPTQQLAITPTLFDQAGDVMNIGLSVTIKDAEGDLVFEETVTSNEQTALTLPQDAVPGLWTISASGLGVTTEKAITVDELGNIALAVNGELLSITNTGNIKVKQAFNFLLSTATEAREFTKKLTLSPGETEIIDLARGTNPGTYTVTVDQQTFNDVTITKKKSSIAFSWEAALVFLIVVLLLWFVFLRLGKRPKKYHRKARRENRVHHFKKRSESHHVKKFHQDMKEHADKKRGFVRFNIKKKQDEFIMELPKKKVRSSTASESTAWSNKSSSNDTAMLWGKDDASAEDDVVDPFKGVEKPPEKKKGLFNMFD